MDIFKSLFLLVILGVSAIGCTPVFVTTRTQPQPELQDFDNRTTAERALFQQGYLQAIEDMRREMVANNTPATMIPRMRESEIKFYMNPTATSEYYYIDRDSWNIRNAEGDLIEFGLNTPDENQNLPASETRNNYRNNRSSDNR